MSAWNRRGFCLLMAVLWGAAVGWAGEADVVDVSVSRTGNDTYRFDVTVRHDDAGWDHYANQWQVVAPDGRELGTRVLLHPHDDEQPFTRSLNGVRIGNGIKEVTVRARDSRHDWGGAEMKIRLPD